MNPNQWLATLLALVWQRNMEYVDNRALRHLWRIGKMGRLDAAMKDVVASSFILSTTPFGTSDSTILITAPLFVSLPVGNRGESKRSSLVSLTFLSPFVFGMQALLTTFLQS